MIKLHKQLIECIQNKFNLSTYALLWIAFTKGIIISALVYHFFLR